MIQYHLKSLLIVQLCHKSTTSLLFKFSPQFIIHRLTRLSSVDYSSVCGIMSLNQDLARVKYTLWVKGCLELLHDP